MTFCLCLFTLKYQIKYGEMSLTPNPQMRFNVIVVSSYWFWDLCTLVDN